MSETTKSKREIIADCIEAGGATMESLIEAADCKYESVMSNFSMLRLMGKCPVKDVEIDGVMTYRFASAEEWEEIKAEKSANAATKRATAAKSPAQRLAAAVKRVARCDTAAVNARKRADEGNDDELLNLRADKAEIELRIAEIEKDTAAELVNSDDDAKAEFDQLTNPAPVTDEASAADESNEDIDFD